MNKKVFTGLLVLMGISILGIIFVQLVWINNAIKVKNELFARDVNEALNNTTNQLERLHDVNVVNEMMFSDSVGWNGTNPKNPGLNVVFKKHLTPSAPIKIIRESGNTNGNAKIHIQIISEKDSIGGFQYSYQTNHFRTSSKTDQLILNKKNDSNQNIVIVRDSLVGDADSMYTVGIVMIDSLENCLDPISMVAPEFTKRVKLKATRLKDIASQVVTEVSTWDVYEVDHTLIKNELQKAFSDQNIGIGFEYGILRDSVISEKSDNADTLKLVNSSFKANLYPNNIFQKDLKLAVYFPGKDSLIFRSINWLLMASFVFSMIILVTFALSIFYILRQKKISEMKSDFINNMTHEFKTPIATISVATDSISNDKVIGNPEKIRYFTGMIKKENIRMNRQVEDILTIARLDKKEFEFNWEPINAHDLIEDAIQSISIQVEKRLGKIETNLLASNPVVTTDKFHCTNVVYNLLDNAIKYSVEPPSIYVFTKNTPLGILISVRDNGIGMSKVVQGRIFEKFYRQEGGNIHNVKGFGLGLSYSKAVVEANHGKITVQSEPGKGSNFDVFLPFTRQGNGKV
jgi:two-component system, OmpR family, phosphate regulon sensor histidine kinase PhoR